MKTKCCIRISIRIYKLNFVLTDNISKTCVYYNHIHLLLNSTSNIPEYFSEHGTTPIKTGLFKTQKNIQIANNFR